MKRPAVLLLAGFALALPASAELVSAELDTYRFGATFVRHAAEDAETCSALCEASSRCMAWSLISAEDANGAACELKAGTGRPEFRPGYVSGMSGYRIVSAPETVTVAEAAAPVVAAGYQPVSAGTDVDELLGGSASASALVPTALPASDRTALAPTAPTDPMRRSFAPRRVSGGTFGTVDAAGELVETAEAGS